VRRLLPATAVVIGMRYNSQLIDEVIGVAQATFAPEAKLANRAITDDSSSEVKVDKAGDNAQKTDEQAEQTDNSNHTDTAKESAKKDTEDKDTKSKDAKSKEHKDTANKNAKNSDKTKADKKSAEQSSADK